MPFPYAQDLFWRGAPPSRGRRRFALGTTGAGLVGRGRASQWLQRDDLREAARRAARQLASAADPKHDIVHGGAGTILALLALFGDTQETVWLEAAMQVGRGLLQANPVTSGFSHGAAGMALALLRLHKACGEPIFGKAARELVAYEDRLFDPEAGNWLDLRPPMPGAPADERCFCGSWCHGGPGIALARLGGLSVWDDSQVRADLEAGLRVARAEGVRALDTLCCGNWGLVDIFWEAGHRLDRQDLCESARNLAAAARSRADQEGYYRLGWSRPQRGRLAFPGLYQGLSGIGYVALRLAEPTLPCLLLWE